MRTVNFRDGVLWAIAYKLGLDPQVELLMDQAVALASYINGWVRRLWPAADWPEWTLIEAFVPANHIVPYSYLRPTGLTEVGRVFKVYLADPRTTPGDGLDTPHKLLPNGIHVGFEHGSTVWIKYQEPPPRYTADVWSSSRTYLKGELAYSPRTGECYSSKVNANRGHDPAATSSVPLPTEVTQDFVAQQPEQPVPQPKIMELMLLTDIEIPDPHPAGGVFEATIHDAAGVILSSQLYSNVGTESIASILTAWAALFDADPALATFTITVDSGRKVIRFQDNSDFQIDIASHADPAHYYPDLSSQEHFLKNYTVQPYFPSLSPVATPAQVTEIILTSDQVVAGGVYTIAGRDEAGIVYEVTYTALAGDGPNQILEALAAAIGAATVAVEFWRSVSTVIDTVSQKLTIISGAPMSIDAQVAPPGSAWWLLVPFPEALADPVIRGAYADALKEGGQSDKGTVEEQAVAVEAQVRTSILTPQQDQTLSDQNVPRERFAVSNK